MSYHDPYEEFVEQEALKIGKVFRLDSGEGRDGIDEITGWYVEDLSGWLINPSDSECFIESRKEGTTDDVFEDEYVFAIWSKDENGALSIDFKKY